VRRQSPSISTLIASAAALLCARLCVAAATNPEVDPANALRGSLGVALADLSLDHPSGRLFMLLNGGCALLFGALACFALARRRPRDGRLSGVRPTKLKSSLSGLHDADVTGR